MGISLNLNRRRQEKQQPVFLPKDSIGLVIADNDGCLWEIVNVGFCPFVGESGIWAYIVRVSPAPAHIRFPVATYWLPYSDIQPAIEQQKGLA